MTVDELFSALSRLPSNAEVCVVSARTVTKTTDPEGLAPPTRTGIRKVVGYAYAPGLRRAFLLTEGTRA